jgi:hypothetical protein
MRQPIRSISEEDAMPLQSPRVLILWGQWWVCFTHIVLKTYVESDKKTQVQKGKFYEIIMLNTFINK